MVFEVVKSIERPPSVYAKLTKGTFLEPWILKAWNDKYYFNKPFNVWERHTGLFERVARASHLGAVVGVVTGGTQFYHTNLDMGRRHMNQFRNKLALSRFGHGCFTGLLQSTVFTLTVSALSKVNNRDDTSLDWYFGGLAMGLTGVAMSQLKSGYCSTKWNSISIIVFPFFPAAVKSLRIWNEYDDVKGGRNAMTVGGPGGHTSVAEMRGLYGLEPEKVPLHQYLNLNGRTEELLFLQPRRNPDLNDKFRVEE